MILRGLLSKIADYAIITGKIQKESLKEGNL
jgi:hypothetical protein